MGIRVEKLCCPSVPYVQRSHRSKIVPGTDKALPENSQQNLNEKLDRAVEDTFPSSDPVSVSITKGGAMEYDHDDDEAEDPSILRSNLGKQGTSESLLNQAKEKLGKLLNQNNPANGERAAAALVPVAPDAPPATYQE